MWRAGWRARWQEVVDHNTILKWIRYINIAGNVKSNIIRRAQEPVAYRPIQQPAAYATLAIVAYGRDVVSARVKLLDTIIVKISYKNIPTAINSDADGAVEFIVARTMCAQGQDECSIGVKLLDAVIETVCHIYLATCIDCNSEWPLKIPAATA